MAAGPYTLPDLILWDVIEEHFNEAEFLLEQWEGALHSPVYTLDELGATLEQRLEAHIDGLLIGGPSVAKGILEPELENATEPTRAAVAALVLLGSEETAAISHVLEVIPGAEVARQEALARALILSDATRIDQIVYERFRRAPSDPEKAVWLKVLNGRGVDTGELLNRCFDSDEPRLVGDALEAVRRFARREMIALAEKHLQSDHPAVRTSAIKASLALGSGEAWQLCLQLARASEAGDPEIRLLIAILGQPQEHQLLYRLLDNSQGPERLLWTLGFCGTVEAGDVGLAYLRSEDARVARAAAEAMAWIGGFDLNQDEFQLPPLEPEEDATLPLFEADDLDADLTLDGVDDLPDPNRDAIARWWEENRGRLTQNQRYLLGQPSSPEAMVHALEVGSLWRRHGVALELSLRTGGEYHVSTGAFSSRQRRQMAALRTMNLER